MSSPACIFHHPFPVEPHGTSGSRVRPYQMLKAFERLGYEVTAITGYARERRRQIDRLRVDIARGKRFDFAYSESHTLPLQLTEPHHFPSHPFVDGRLFHTIKRTGIPLGLFYRDVYWRFDQFKETYPGLKRHLAVLFYRQEWRLFRKHADHLFLPSLSMASALPTTWPADRLSALPPGIDRSIPLRRCAPTSPSALRLLYVGGTTPPLYDLTPLFEAVRGSEQMRLTLCCRRAEWNLVSSRYQVPDNVEVVHASGEQLDVLYEQADLAAIVREPHPYLDFAMPVKVFEALGHGLPVVTLAGNETARFVQEQDVGWVLGSPSDLRALADDLLNHPAKLEDAFQRVESVQGAHSWQARAQRVAETLTGLMS